MDIRPANPARIVQGTCQECSHDTDVRPFLVGADHTLTILCRPCVTSLLNAPART